jgi:hypothetical protein
MRSGCRYNFLLFLARWCGVCWRVELLAAPSPFLDLLIVLRNLRGGIGGWCVRGLVGSALGILLFGRLGAVMLRMERMTARFLAGGLWRIEGRVGGARAAASGVGRREARVWPGGFGWLVRMVGWQAAGYGSQLRAVLTTPEMVALLTASPEAGRVLRPVCRLLGIESSVLRPGVAVVEKPVRAAAVRVRKPRVTEAAPWRIPLPRGVMAWARREGFGKIPRD